MGEHCCLTETTPQQETFDPRLGADLLWRDLRVNRFPKPAATLFLDRDGVIIEEKEYIANPDDVELLPGITDLIRTARKAGMAVVEITNQAGIGRGYFGWQEFVLVENRTMKLLAERGEQLDAVFSCPFHPDGQPRYRVAGHAWRKPNPGMLLEAARLLNLDLPRSVLVGDKIADHAAGRAAGLAFAVHVLTGHGREHAAAVSKFAPSDFQVQIVPSPQEAAALLLEHKSA